MALQVQDGLIQLLAQGGHLQQPDAVHAPWDQNPLEWAGVHGGARAPQDRITLDSPAMVSSR